MHKEEIPIPKENIPPTPCRHCETPTISPIFNEEKTPFCCRGCLSVYHLLRSENLEAYYDLNQNAHPIELSPQDYEYLNDSSFLENFSTKTEEGLKIKFYLEGIHCAACLWLIEKLPQILEGVHSTKLNMSNATCNITFDPNVVKLSSIAQKLASLGYPSHPVRPGQNQETFIRKEKKKDLTRLGVAGALAGNIMIYSYSLYSGASGEYETMFRWANMGLSLPIVFYSAIPFYQNALSSIKNKIVSIDIPVVVAIILAQVWGTINLFRGEGELYFDSIATLIFFLLGARLLLKYSYKKEFLTGGHQFLLDGTPTKVWTKNQFQEKLSDFVQIGDRVLVETGKAIPADGPIIKGKAFLDQSLISGESKPVEKQTGDEVLRGIVNIGPPFEIEAKTVGRQTHIGKLLTEIEDGWSRQSKIVQKTDKVAQYFLLVIFIIATIIFIFKSYQHNPSFGMNSALALIIVSCPCALGLATPLALLRSLKLALKAGIVIKRENSFDKLREIKQIFFDKTGTLTNGKFNVIKATAIAKTEFPLESIIYQLESISKHPIAIGLREYFQTTDHDTLDFEDHREVSGIGVFATWKGHEISLKKYEKADLNHTHLALSIDKIPCYLIELGDELRVDSTSTLQHLGNQFPLSIISGDSQSVVDHIAKKIGITFQTILGELKPEDKKEILENSPNSMLVGDGLNDAWAMSKAHLSVAVSSSSLISLKTSDIYLSRPGIGQLEKLFTLSRETIRLIARNIIISLAYNVLVIILCFFDMITPLSAAIIMPVSSFSIFFSTLLGTKKMRNLK